MGKFSGKHLGPLSKVKVLVGNPRTNYSVEIHVGGRGDYEC